MWPDPFRFHCIVKLYIHNVCVKSKQEIKYDETCIFRNPNLGINSTIPDWPKFDTLNRAFMNLTESPHADTMLFPDRVTFWTDTVPELTRKRSESSNETSRPTEAPTDTNAASKLNYFTLIGLAIHVCII